jgi:hypothetical protein
VPYTFSCFDASGPGNPVVTTATHQACHSDCGRRLLVSITCAMSTARLLLQLASQFESQHDYQQAVQSLTAVCSLGSELPSVLAQARLHLACLLLEHYDNFQEAKMLLLTAVRSVGIRSVLARLPGCGCIRSRLPLLLTSPPACCAHASAAAGAGLEAVARQPPAQV